MVGEPEGAPRPHRDLAQELEELRARVASYESSRWWRLHPRVALRRLVGRGSDTRKATREGAERLPPDFDELDREVWELVAPFTMTTPSRVYALVRAVEYVVAARVPGALVECGVWRGGSMMAVAHTLLRLGATDRDLYLYDTFEGMTEPGQEDVRVTGEAAAELLERLPRTSNEWAVATLEEVRSAMGGVGYPEDRIRFVCGRVEETLPEHAPDEIALLRLDTDWYASTLHELRHLYPRLATGGVLIVDDYGYWQGQRRAVDEYLAEQGIALLLNRIDPAARIAVKT
ncbi:MAG: TylF/MycF/NovP-related O-methyltransferase [Thermoleophilia bacterium]|nr:TylF/MycF/NovP-related O-methyltransferase [Thermoleophilia bacterium]